MRRAIFALLVVCSMLMVGCNTVSNSSLQGHTWYLTSGISVKPQWLWNVRQDQVSAYTIVFNSATNITVRADCNNVLGQYTTTASGGMTLTPNVVSLSFCGPKTHDKLYLAMLQTTTGYTVAATDLKLTLADGGSLSYTSVAPASPVPGASGSASPSPTATASPSASPTPSEEASASPTESATATPTEKPTSSPTGQPTSGATATPKPTSGATATPKPTEKPTEAPTPSASPPAAVGLIGKEWKLTAITVVEPPFQGAVDPTQQPNYTITFVADATFSAKADCNTLSGSYTTPDATASAGTLTITPGPATLVACPSGSLSQLYMDALGQAASYAIADNLLTITLVDGGTLQYQ